METVRAFLALEVSDDVKRSIMKLEDEVANTGADVRLVEKENLHITLKFLGEIGEDAIAKVLEAMRTVKADAFALEVEGAGAFPGARMPRILWVGAGSGGEKVASIAQQLESALAIIGFPKDREFTPHITVGRVKSMRNNATLARSIQENRGTHFGSTQITRIALKKSVLTPSGPIYSDIGDVKLGQGN